MVFREMIATATRMAYNHQQLVDLLILHAVADVPPAEPRHGSMGD
jgi:hypothetical protein